MLITPFKNSFDSICKSDDGQLSACAKCEALKQSFFWVALVALGGRKHWKGFKIDFLWLYTKTIRSGFYRVVCNKVEKDFRGQNVFLVSD